jgi:hypothetical protein
VCAGTSTSSPGPDAEGGDRGGQREGVARGQRDVLGAEILRVALLEAVAFQADAVAEQGTLADHRGDGIDFILAHEIQGAALLGKPGILRQHGAGFRAPAFPITKAPHDR